MSYKERKLSFCTLYGAWGDDFHKKFQILEKKNLFYFISHYVVMLLLLLHKPSKAVGTFRASPWYEQSCFSWNVVVEYDFFTYESIGNFSWIKSFLIRYWLNLTT